MEFIIERTSGGYSSSEKPITDPWGKWERSKPCKEAILRRAAYIDRRIAETLQEAKTKSWGKEFFESGENHREELGMVARDLGEREIYVIKIDTLEELIALYDRYGSIILSEQDRYKGYKYSLEIYDGWRE